METGRYQGRVFGYAVAVVKCMCIVLLVFVTIQPAVLSGIGGIIPISQQDNKAREVMIDPRPECLTFIVSFWFSRDMAELCLFVCLFLFFF